MPDSDLMFRPATELAAMVRSGEISARELVEISLERIEELNPHAERVRARSTPSGRSRPPTQIAPGDERPVRGCADRDQEQPPGRGAAPDATAAR